MEGLGVNIDGLALDLVGPAAIVPQASDNGINITTSHGDGLAVVERLDSYEEIPVLFDKSGEVEKKDAALLRGGCAPLALEHLAGSGDGNINILLSSLGNRADDLLCGGVDDLKGLLVHTLDELIVDEADDYVRWSWCRKGG